jgi:hypothetical protein
MTMSIIINDCYAIASASFTYGVTIGVDGGEVKSELTEVRFHIVKFKNSDHKWSIKY